MPILFEELRQLLIERLLVVGKGEKYNQVVLLAGGPGSGKSHVVKNLIGGEWKVHDPDALKFMLIKLGKNIEAYRELEDKYGKQAIADVLNTGTDAILRNLKGGRIDTLFKGVSKFDLKKNPKDVETLHNMVKGIGFDKKQMMLSLVHNIDSPNKPNIIIDRTMQTQKNSEELIQSIRNYGYKAENIHIVWVLTDYREAIFRNYFRDRRIYHSDVLKAHIGVKNTMNNLVLRNYKGLGINGDVTVVLNDGKELVPKYIRVKRAGKTGFDETGISKLVAEIEKLTPPSDQMEPELDALDALYPQTKRK